MDSIREIVARLELPPPDSGFDAEKESFHALFSVELREDIHKGRNQ